MEDFDFNKLSNDGAGAAGSTVHDLHDAHVQAFVEDGKPVALDTTASKGGKHKKDHVEPAPAPVEVEVEVEDLDLSTSLAPTHDENKGFMRFMPPLIKEMNRRGVPFKLDGASGEIAIAGFYRSGGVSLEIGDGDTITAVDRRNTRTTVSTFDDLVRLNYDWWLRTNGKTGENHLNPDRPWLDEFLTRGMVKRQVIFVPRDDAPGGED